MAAVLERGSGRMQLIGHNGNMVGLDLRSHVRGRTLEQKVRERVAPELLVPFDEEAARDPLNLAREKLGFRTRVATEIESLPRVLQRGEHVLTLAVAVHKRQRGLLALSNRRIVHIARAGTRKPRLFELQLSEVAGVRAGRLDLFSRKLKVRTTAGKKHTFFAISPGERATELHEALASPLHPHFTPQTVDTSLRGVVRAYSFGVLLVVVGLVAAGSSALPVAFWPLVLGVPRLFRTYRRRRAASAASSPS